MQRFHIHHFVRLRREMRRRVGGGPRVVASLVALAAAVLLTAAAAACGDDEPSMLVVLTHDSFDAREEVIAAFEERFDVRVELLPGGDANQLVNRAILGAGNPEADLLFGVDNLSFQRAAEAGVFASFTAERRGEVPAELRAQFGDSMLVTPIDYGFVALNFDRAAGQPPTSFEELATEPWAGRLVVEDPATSSPGLQFLASTVAHFGEDGPYSWREYWRDLRANGVLVADGWSAAYYTHFSQYGGDRPVVVSYTTSPAAEVYFGELDEPPTVNVIPAGALFRQVEAAGVLAGADEPELAGRFIDHMLSAEFQSQIPETMFVYPVIPGTSTPAWWRWAEVEVAPAVLDVQPEAVERWIVEWTEIMRR